MGPDPVPVSNPDDFEKNGLTVLGSPNMLHGPLGDTRRENDRLGLIRFSTRAKVVEPLLPMASSHNASTWYRQFEVRTNDKVVELPYGIYRDLRTEKQRMLYARCYDPKGCRARPDVLCGRLQSKLSII